MGFTKYQKTEKTEVVSPAGHKAIGDELKKLGKKSAKGLDETERKAISDRIDTEQ